LPLSLRAGAARQKTSKRCVGHGRWSNVPQRKYSKYSSFLFSPTSQGLSLPPLHTYFTGSTFRHREISFYLGFVIPFPRALFVDGHPSGGVSLSILLLRSDSTLLLTSTFILPPVVFGLNHFYQSSLYCLNSNPSPRHYIVISSSPFLLAKPLYQTAVSPIISSPSIRLPRGAIPALFLHWYPSPVLERISAFRYFNFYLALCVLCSALACHLAIFAVSTRNTIKSPWSTLLGTGVPEIQTNILRPHLDARDLWTKDS